MHDHPPLSVVELPTYAKRAETRLTAEEAAAVIALVARDPKCGDLIPGGGGVRKVRFGAGSRGKSGGVRVIYYFHDADNPVFLLTLFAKNEQANLSKAERNELAKLVKLLVDTY